MNWFQRKAKLKNSTETNSDLEELEQTLNTELPEVSALLHVATHAQLAAQLEVTDLLSFCSRVGATKLIEEAKRRSLVR